MFTRQDVIFLIPALLLWPSFFKQEGSRSITKPSVQQERQYDNAGPYVIANNTPLARRNEILARIRGFLWDHWSGRRLGHLDVTVFTVEGDPTAYKFAVETDAKGRWGIHTEITLVIRGLAPTDNTPKHETKQITYYDVERIGAESGEAIGSNAKLQPEAYRVRLNNKDGPTNFVW